MEENNDNGLIESNKKPKKSIRETIVLMFRKKWLSNTAQTFILIAILFAIFVGINIGVQKMDLEPYDVTKNKIYTLSDESKKVIKNINKDVIIYAYGVQEDSNLVDFIKQYSKTNEHIKYEILTEANNPAKVKEFDLQSGYQVVVLECGEASKIIDVANEFQSYDYTTGQEVDLTEQTLTNSLLGITTDKKPKVYFTNGHDEALLDKQLVVLKTYLSNESYDATSVNLLTEGKVPDDCNLLIIMAPKKDFMEQEIESILNFINNGGNIIISMDVGNISETYPNLQKIYNQYGATINHTGFIYETDSRISLANDPSVFMPSVSESNEITREIYSDGFDTLWLAFAGRIEFVSDEELNALNVEKEDLLFSSDNSLFINDFSQDLESAVNSAEKGKSIISSLLTKTISKSDDENIPSVESKAVFIANSAFITDDSVIPGLSSSYPLSYLGNNKDFMLNSISYLTEKENTLKIRKDMSNSTYTPTAEQNRVVISIIFAVPFIIIIMGIVVWQIRRRKR